MLRRRSLVSVTLALIVALALMGSAAAGSRTFKATLSGEQEVANPPVETSASGKAMFHLNKDGTELRFKLFVAGIVNVTQAHIHCAAEGDNGPVVAWLYPSEPPAVLIESPERVLSSGVITSEDVIARSEADFPTCPGGVASFDDLIAQIEAGNAYVNVHTSQYPAGEIRGQIR